MCIFGSLSKIRLFELVLIYVDLLFCSTDQLDLFLCQYHAVYLLCLCNIIWNHQILFPQDCFGYLYASKWIWKFIFLFLWTMALEFWWGLYWICRLLLVNTDTFTILILPTNEQEAFLVHSTFFSFCHQHFKAVVVFLCW